MKCAGCAQVVERRLTQYAGINAATVNLVTEKAWVEYDPGLDDDSLVRALSDHLAGAGFSAERTLPGASGLTDENRQEKQAQMRRLAIATLLLLFSAIGHAGELEWFRLPVLSTIWFHFWLATAALVGPGREILQDGWQGFWRRLPNMNSLVGLGMVTSYGASAVALLYPSLHWECFFDEPVMLVGFILLGRTLEHRARSRAASSLRSLLSLQPTQARRLLTDKATLLSQKGILNLSQSQTIPAEALQTGQILAVLPGEKIPADGSILVGKTTVDESLLTGESLPVVKDKGDPLSAGSLNQTGAIAVEVTRVGDRTTLAQIIQLVETAQIRKAPIQRLADTAAGYFTYGVLAVAALTFLFWYGIGTSLFPEILQAGAAHLHHMPHHAQIAAAPLIVSLKLSIAVLVVACPCALGLATPTAILVGSGLGAEQGVLIRGGDVLETVHQLDTVVFDKTGTLTVGQPVLAHCQLLSDRFGDRVEPVTEAYALQLAAAAEQGTHHPIAIALQNAASRQALPALEAQAFQTAPGGGVLAVVDGHQIHLGSPDWLKELGIDASDGAPSIAPGDTAVMLAVDRMPVASFAVRDEIRENAAKTLRQLQEMGLQVVMLTGDRLETAAAVAETLGLPMSQVQAQVKPEQKAATITQLQTQGQTVAMVGDGINDAPALAQADVGISLHDATDIAVETADIILTTGRLTDVTRSIRLSQRVFNKIRQNLFWAFAYNILGIPAAAGLFFPLTGLLLSPATAGALMALSSVSVVTNSLLLNYDSEVS